MSSRLKTEKIYPDAEIVIVGGGGAGLAAAVEAAEKGVKRIIVVEKRGSLGGNTAMAGGLFACESPVQARNKIIADRDRLFKKAMEWAHWDKVNPAILRAFINKSGETIRWLEGKGLEFDLIRFYPDQYPPVQHNPKGNGARLTKILADNCEKFGVLVYLNSRCKKIIMGKKGEITGVIVLKEEREIKISTGCVVISTGGFGGNPDLLNNYCSSWYKGMLVSGLPLTGDGLFLAEEAGAALENFATMVKEGPRFDPYKWPLMTLERDPSTLWVNKKGERFIDESFGDHVFESVNAMLLQPDKLSFALFDAAIRNKFEEKMPGLVEALQSEMTRGRVIISETWDDIAEWIGADPFILNGTIVCYNACCEKGYDELFAKDRRYLLPLNEPPYYAIKGLSVLLDTIGGIKINERMEVLDHQKDPIPGFYAAGVVTSGWQSENYCSELSASAFGFAINSGRIAGENAARYASFREY